MSRSYFARKIAAELDKIHRGEEQPGKRAELVEWFNTYREKGHLKKEEINELERLFETELSMLPFAELVPKGWFKDLLELVEQTESPTPFHLLSALCVVGSIVGRDVMIDRGTHVLNVAPSALLISPAGRGRRSTACDFVVYELGTRAGLKVIADSFTYEGFGDAMTGLPTPTCLVYAGEMASLIGKGSYGESIIPKLTDLLGKTSRFQWTTVKRGTIIFEKPCVNALFTSAPDWLVNNVPQIVFGGGMLRRFLVCVQEKRERIVSWADPIDEHAKLRLIEGLKTIGKRKGLFMRPTGEAFDWYNEWYQRHSKKVESGEIGDERMAPYLSTKHDQLLRLAALFALAAGEETLTFTVPRFEQALKILDWLEMDIPRAYSAMALSPIASAQQAVVRVLEQAGGSMEHGLLHKKVYRVAPLSSMFREVIDSLIEMEVIQMAPSLSARRGRTYLLRRTLE